MSLLARLAPRRPYLRRDPPARWHLQVARVNTLEFGNCFTGIHESAGFDFGRGDDHCRVK